MSAICMICGRRWDSNSYSPMCKGGGPHRYVSVGNEAKSKPTNPKDLLGTSKLPLHLFPVSAIAVGSLAMLDGALKYGRNNFRAVGVRASVYVAAALRHLTRWNEGQDIDTDSGVHELGHALACLAILMEAIAQKNLVDDRNYGGAATREFIASLVPQVDALRERKVAKEPKHYTIEDDTHE